jgi:hypothetical protein
MSAKKMSGKEGRRSGASQADTVQPGEMQEPLDSEKKSKPLSYNPSQALRRRIIHDALVQRGFVTMAEIQAELERWNPGRQVNRNSVREDINWWIRTMEIPLERSLEGNSLSWRWIESADDPQRCRRLAVLAHLLQAAEVEIVITPRAGADYSLTEKDLREDIDSIAGFNNWGAQMVKDGHGETALITSYSALRGSAKFKRGLSNQDGKKQISRVAASLVLGTSEGTGTAREVLASRYVGGAREKLLAPLFVVERVLQMRGELPGATEVAAKRLEALAVKLKRYTSVASRTIYLDSSTTVDAVSGLLSAVSIPFSCQPQGVDDEAKKTLTGASFLEAWTSSRTTFSRLGAMNVNIRTLVLPGWQDQDNETLCTFFARDFISRVDPKFGMCLVGAPGLDLERNLLGASHHSDGDLKLRVLERSQIRVVLADFSKFNAQRYDACGSISDNIDLIISDRVPADADAQLRTQILQFQAQHGIPILFAEDLLDRSQAW